MRDVDAVRKEICTYAYRAFGWKLPQIDGDFTHWVGGPGGDTFGSAPVAVLDWYRQYLESMAEAESGA